MNHALITLAIAAASFICGASIVISVRYYTRWRAGRGNLLPLHVWTIALSYNLLLMSVILRIATMPWWAQAINVAGLLLGIVAMTSLLMARGRAT